MGINVLLDDRVPDAAFRFYGKLRALAWGEDQLSMKFKRLMELTGLSRTRIYEYARILRFNRGLLSYAVRNDAFECSFPPETERTVNRPRPEKRDLPSPLSLSSKSSLKQEPKDKPIKAMNTEKREAVNYYPIAAALADVCHMQLEANRSRLFAEAKRLAKVVPPATAELLREQYNGNADGYWRAQDWRGKKGEPPNPSTIRETWGRWLDAPAQTAGKYDALIRSLEDDNGEPV